MDVLLEEKPRRPRRPRSSRGLRLDAQIKLFNDKNGGLEGIRKQLGLRPSQISDLLKVHPSAWIRWTRKGQPAPPHVYQMLEWYLEILKWRGQHAEPEKFEPDFRSKDDVTESTISSETQTQLEKLLAQGAFIERPQIFKILKITWVIQGVLWLGMILWFKYFFVAAK